MRIKCPFCKEPYDIEESDLNRHLKCCKCDNKFTCSVIAAPNLGTMYLDIQLSSDPSHPDAEVSTIVWWCNEKWHSWVKGKNDPEEFLIFWRNTPRIITFNGKVLDEPRICKEFNISPHVIHRDLFFEVQRKGLPPDLKKISELSEFPMVEAIQGVDSKAEAELWKQYSKDGSQKALDNLLCCSAWEIVHTYHLHCHLSDNATPVSMHETIPFPVDNEFLKTLTGLPDKKKTEPVIQLKKTDKVEKPFIKIKRPSKPTILNTGS